MTELFPYREGFTTLCLEFQRDIDIGKNDELRALLSEKDLLENEIHLLDKKNNALKNSMLAFVEEILEDLHKSNAGNIHYYCFINFFSFKGMVT